MTAGNQSINRSWAILESLAGVESGLSFTDLRQRLPSTGAATLSRLLKALHLRALIEHVGDRYRVGPALVSIADRVLPAQRLRRLQDAVDRLAALSGQSALVCERSGDATAPRLVRRCRRHTDGGFAYGDLDEPLPLLAMAFGWPLLAGCPLPVQEALLYEHRALPDEPAIDTELAALARDGVLVRSERLNSNALGCTRIVAPLPDRSATCSIGITVIGQAGRDHSPAQVARWCAQVRASAQEQA